MTVKVGWNRTKGGRERPAGKIAGGLYLFELVKVDLDSGRGRHIVVGYLHYTRADLERIKEKGYKLDVRVVGVLRFDEDVSPELYAATIGRVTGMGRLGRVC